MSHHSAAPALHYPNGTMGDAIKTAVDEYNHHHHHDPWTPCPVAHAHHPPFQTDRNTAVILIAVLIVIGLIFEKGVLGYLNRLAHGPMKPIVDALLAEVCMLGFIGMILYISVHKTDILNKLSDEIYDDDMHLIHLLEDVHFGMFWMLCVLVLQAFYMVFYSRRKAKSFDHANENAMENPDEIIDAYVDAENSCFKRTFGSQAHDQMHFLALRSRFVDGSKKPEESKAKEAKEAKEAGKSRGKQFSTIPHNFEFNEYLGHIMGEMVGESVEIPLFIWFILMLVCVMYWGIVYKVNFVEDYTPVFIGCGLLMCLFLLSNYRWLKSIEAKLTSPHVYNIAEQRRAVAATRAVGPDAGTASAPLNAGSHKMYDHADVDQDPPYVSESKPGIGPSFCVSKLCCLHRHPMSKHVALFPFGPEGPEFFMRLLQLVMVFCAMYVGFFIVQIPHILEVDKTEYHAAHHGHGPAPEPWMSSKAEAWSMVIGAFVPVLIMLFLLPKTIAVLVNVSSVEQLKRLEVIADVRREMGTKKAIRAMKLLRMMKSNFKAKKNRVADIPKSTKIQQIDMSAEVVQKHRAEVQEMFNLFDTSGDGEIDRDELFALLKVMNIESEKEAVSQILQEIDHDHSGVIDFDEFFEWYVVNHLSDDDDESSLEDYIDDMFAMLKAGQDDEISKEAFATSLAQIGGGMAADDITSIFNSIDNDHSGAISKRELKEFIEHNAAAF